MVESAAIPAPSWQRLETWLHEHRRHFDHLAEGVLRQRYGRGPAQHLRIVAAPTDRRQVVVFGPDGTTVLPLRGWATEPFSGAPDTGRRFAAVLDRTRRTLWVPEASGRIALVLDPQAGAGEQVDDVDRLLAHLQAVDRQRRLDRVSGTAHRFRQYLLRHPQTSRGLQGLTAALVLAGACYLLAVPGPGKSAVFVGMMLVFVIGHFVDTTEKIRKRGWTGRRSPGTAAVARPPRRFRLGWWLGR